MASTRTTPIPDSLEDLGNHVSDIEKRTRAFAAQHPLMALGTALTVGYLLGRTFSRRLT